MLCCSIELVAFGLKASTAGIGSPTRGGSTIGRTPGSTMTISGKEPSEARRRCVVSTSPTHRMKKQARVCVLVYFACLVLIK